MVENGDFLSFILLGGHCTKRRKAFTCLRGHPCPTNQSSVWSASMLLSHCDQVHFCRVFLLELEILTGSSFIPHFEDVFPSSPVCHHFCIKSVNILTVVPLQKQGLHVKKKKNLFFISFTRMCLWMCFPCIYSV